MSFEYPPFGEIKMNGKLLCNGELGQEANELSHFFQEVNMDMIYSELEIRFSPKVNIFHEFWVKAHNNGQLLLNKSKMPTLFLVSLGMASAFYSKKIQKCRIGEEKYYQVIIKVKNGKVLDIRSEFGDEMDDGDFWYLEEDKIIDIVDMAGQMTFYTHFI